MVTSIQNQKLMNGINRRGGGNAVMDLMRYVAICCPDAMAILNACCPFQDEHVEAEQERFDPFASTRPRVLVTIRNTAHDPTVHRSPFQPKRHHRGDTVSTTPSSKPFRSRVRSSSRSRRHPPHSCTTPSKRCRSKSTCRLSDYRKKRNKCHSTDCGREKLLKRRGVKERLRVGERVKERPDDPKYHRRHDEGERDRNDRGRRTDRAHHGERKRNHDDVPDSEAVPVSGSRERNGKGSTGGAEGRVEDGSVIHRAGKRVRLI